MALLAIRWLGAFRSGSATLTDSFQWELSENCREVAAEVSFSSPFFCSQISHALIGLRVAKGAIRRAYTGDVWSEVRDGRLISTRTPSSVSKHSEAFCAPRYDAIVAKRPLDQLRPIIRRQVVAAARQYHLPILLCLPERWSEKAGAWLHFPLRRVKF